MNVKLRQLEGFVAVAEGLSFTKAAMQLAMTQSALSRLIGELERTAGVRLLERTTRRVVLTEAGAALLVSIRGPLKDLDHAYASLRDMARGHPSSVSVGILPSVSLMYLTRLLRAFKQDHPGIHIRLIEETNDDLLSKVLDREVDFGIGMLTAPQEGLDVDPWFEDEVVAVFPRSHPFARRRSIPWRALAEQPLILLPPASSARRLVDAGLTFVDAPREPTYEVLTVITCISMARAGFGLTILPVIALESLNMNGMTYRPIGHPKPMRRIGLISRAGRHPSAGAAAFQRYLKVSLPSALGAAKGLVVIHAQR